MQIRGKVKQFFTTRQEKDNFSFKKDVYSPLISQKGAIKLMSAYPYSLLSCFPEAMMALNRALSACSSASWAFRASSWL